MCFTWECFCMRSKVQHLLRTCERWMPQSVKLTNKLASSDDSWRMIHIGTEHWRRQLQLNHHGCCETYLPSCCRHVPCQILNNYGTNTRRIWQRTFCITQSAKSEPGTGLQWCHLKSSSHCHCVVEGQKDQQFWGQSHPKPWSCLQR